MGVGQEQDDRQEGWGAGGGDENCILLVRNVQVYQNFETRYEEGGETRSVGKNWTLIRLGSHNIQNGHNGSL